MVEQSSLLSPERGAFLKERFGYWADAYRETGGNWGIEDARAIRGE